MQTHLFGLFARLLGDACHGLAVALAFLHFLEDDVGHLEVAVQIVVKFFLDEVAHELGYGGAFRSHIA